MSYCPKCHAEINYLEFKYNTIQKGVCMIDISGDLDCPSYDTEILSEDYFCPRCSEKLDIDNPEEFLKGSELDIKDFN